MPALWAIPWWRAGFAGVVVDDGTDIGGGASIMGTLSGGGKEVISLGKRCLLGANSGCGISLGDDCVVEAGLYVTAGTKLTVRGSVAEALGLQDGGHCEGGGVVGGKQCAVPAAFGDRRGGGHQLEVCRSGAQ